MKNTFSGFSILFVLMLVAALSIAAISFVRTSSFLTTLAIARQGAEEQYWACQGLKSYARALLQSQGEVPTEPIVIDPWLTQGSRYQGVIRFASTDTEVIATVQLKNQKTVLKELTFTFKKELY